MSRRRRMTPRYGRGGHKPKNLGARITVQRMATDSVPYTFEACVIVGKKGPYGTAECSAGRNPRQAVANAMAKVVKILRKKKGAFRGTR